MHYVMMRPSEVAGWGTRAVSISGTWRIVVVRSLTICSFASNKELDEKCSEQLEVLYISMVGERDTESMLTWTILALPPLLPFLKHTPIGSTCARVHFSYNVLKVSILMKPEVKAEVLFRSPVFVAVGGDGSPHFSMYGLVKLIRWASQRRRNTNITIAWHIMISCSNYVIAVYYATPKSWVLWTMISSCFEKIRKPGIRENEKRTYY